MIALWFVMLAANEFALPISGLMSSKSTFNLPIRAGSIVKKDPWFSEVFLSFYQCCTICRTSTVLPSPCKIGEPFANATASSTVSAFTTIFKKFWVSLRHILSLFLSCHSTFTLFHFLKPDLFSFSVSLQYNLPNL